MVEDEARTGKELEQPPDEKDRVWRIAGMDRVEAPREEDPQGKPQLEYERRQIFERIGEHAFRLDGQGMPVDMNAFEQGV